MLPGELCPSTVISYMLQEIGEDPKREGLRETPNRVVKSWETLYGGYKKDPREVFKGFEEKDCDEIVYLKNIELYSTCEHHMLPFFGQAHIGYLPSGKVIGVSKLARLVEIFARRLQIQERLTVEIANALFTSPLSPRGVAVVIEAKHFCMLSRGVEKQNSIMGTSSMLGVFRTNVSAKDEFLRLIGK